MPTSKMSIMQIFIFVFIYASIAEEMLYRGFLQNILHPLKKIGIRFLKRKISLPVLIAAFMFGLSHLILLSSGKSVFFVLGIVISSSILGTIAGYYQEKHNNTAYSILVHMSGNLVGLIGCILANMNT